MFPEMFPPDVSSLHIKAQGSGVYGARNKSNLRSYMEIRVPSPLLTERKDTKCGATKK